MSLDTHIARVAEQRAQRLAGGLGERRMREDWRELTDAEHEDLDQLMAQFFTGPAADRVIGYLRSITQGRVLGPDSTNDQLRHLEGARWLFSIIDRRIARGRRGPGKDGPR